jgi:transcription termination factor Rho
MPVLDRSELQASPLADLHAIADQLGLEGFRRLRRDELVNAILGESPASDEEGLTGGDGAQEGEREGPEDAGEASEGRPSPLRRLRRARGRGREPETQTETATETERTEGEAASAEGGERDRGQGAGAEGAEEAPGREARGRVARRSAERPGTDGVAAGVVELLGNGSAFLRVNPPEASEEDVYVSAAQVRRCELVSGDRVTGPVRAPRRSERYPSLVRVETINGTPAGEISEGARYEDRPVAYPSDRLALEGGGDATLQAIEWLTPFGRGSRVVIAGPARAGKTEILRRLGDALAGREDLEVSLVLAGVRPEEIAEWGEGPVAPAAALSFAASADAQGRAVEHVIETATRTAARGGDALVLIDTLEHLHPHTARKVLAAARNLRDGGSLTIIATAASPLGGETTVIALDPALASTGGPPLDLIASGTVRAELLVGADGAAAIARARADASSR